MILRPSFRLLVLWFCCTYHSSSFFSCYKATGATPELKGRDSFVGACLEEQERRECRPVIWSDLGQAPLQDLCNGGHFEINHTYHCSRDPLRAGLDHVILYPPIFVLLLHIVLLSSCLMLNTSLLQRKVNWLS